MIGGLDSWFGVLDLDPCLEKQDEEVTPKPNQTTCGKTICVGTHRSRGIKGKPTTSMM